MDAKERSKERKKTVEGKVDKKSQAMDLLKAKREAKMEREAEKEKARIEQEKRREVTTTVVEELFDNIKDDISSVSVAERSMKKKLKASDIYSDDSGSEWENGGPSPKVKLEKAALLLLRIRRLSITSTLFFKISTHILNNDLSSYKGHFPF